MALNAWVTLLALQGETSSPHQPFSAMTLLANPRNIFLQTCCHIYLHYYPENSLITLTCLFLNLPSCFFFNIFFLPSSHFNNPLEKRWANYGPRAKSGPQSLFLANKVLLKHSHASLIFSFCATMAGLSGCDRDPCGLPAKPMQFTYLALYKKSLLTPEIENRRHKRAWRDAENKYCLLLYILFLGGTTWPVGS